MLVRRELLVLSQTVTKIFKFTDGFKIETVEYSILFLCPRKDGMIQGAQNRVLLKRRKQAEKLKSCDMKKG